MDEYVFQGAMVDPVDVPFDVGNNWNITRTMANSTATFTGFARFGA